MLAAIGWKLIDRIGPISPHGVGIAIGYVAGGTLGAARAEKHYGIRKDDIWNALMWAVLGVIVGSRLFFVAGHLDDYFPNVIDIFKVWEGGIVFYGGAIGGIVAGVPYLRSRGIGFWHAMDSIAPGFPLGLIIGRIGDLIIGDHLGGRTQFFLGYRYEGGALPPGCVVPGIDPDPTIVCPRIGEVVHQTALYDFISVLFLFPLILWIGRKRRADGFLFMLMASLYAVGRMLSDFARPAATYGGLRGTQWVSVAIIAFALYWLPKVWHRGPSEKRYDVEEETAGDRDERVLVASSSSSDAGTEMVSEGSPPHPGHHPSHDLPPEGSPEADMVAEGGPVDRDPD